MEEIRQLTIKEPFASLMLKGKLETRTWSTMFRGKVLLHAGKEKFAAHELADKCTQRQFDVEIFDALMDLPEEVAKDITGKVYAIGELVDCRPMKKADEDNAFVAYSSTLYVLEFINVKSIPMFDLKGSQGFRTIAPQTRELLNQSLNVKSYANINGI